MGYSSIPRENPLPLPLGEAAERSEDGEGKRGKPSQSPSVTALPEGEPRGCIRWHEKWSASVPIRSIYCFPATHQRRGVVFYPLKVFLKQRPERIPGKRVRHGNGVGVASVRPDGQTVRAVAAL